MLEASGFDFRVRFPHKHIIKLAKEAKINKEVAKVAYNIMLDLYRTFAPLKQSCAAMSFACIELATTLLETQEKNIRGERAPSYRKWHTNRAEVIETILDLLEHYTHFQKSSAVGMAHPIEKFINIRIQVNEELAKEYTIDRFTEHHELPKTNGLKNIKTPKTPITPASPSDLRINGKDVASPATLSPRSSGSGRKGMGYRGQEGTIRFMLDPEKAKAEQATVAEYFKVEYEEYEVEVEEQIRNERQENHYRGGFRGNGHGYQGHNERYNNNYKRVRR